ncbi:tetratricopeptide repeat protein [Vagococcus elongatus]|uniref:Uncharacterized protein n=1 Tax=Vagococcus elongatus TaxID=180344 RepID=A0A430B5F8_9ENTE|nr:tetratricopeptide repeat protein [Vagococcus elongatus]RSU15584.1 hypothetical protein CBF29_00475 [Vagococcus elongatus]
MTAYSEKMLAAIENDDYVQSEIFLEQALRFDDEEILESLGDALFRMGFLDEAKKIFLQLNQKYPNQTTLNISLAEIAIEEDEIDLALDYLSHVRKDDPGYPESLLVAADLYWAIQAPEISESKLKEALTILPDEPAIKFALGELYFEMEKYSKALAYYQQLIKEGYEEFVQTRIPKKIAMIYSQIGEFDAAVTLFEKELAHERSDDVLYFLALLYVQLGERDKAIPLLQEVRLMGDTYLNVYVPLASALIDENQLEEAEEVLKEGLKENPYDLSLYHLASDFAFQYHRLHEAEEYLLDALKIEEDAELTLIKLSNLFLFQEKYEEVLDLLEEGQELMNVQGHWSLAKAYYGLEEYEKAAKQYQKAYEGLADDPEFMKEFGLFLREEGKIGEADNILRQYITLVPDDVEIYDLLEE